MESLKNNGNIFLVEDTKISKENLSTFAEVSDQGALKLLPQYTKRMKDKNKLFISLICNFIYLFHAKFISRNRYHWLSSVAAIDAYSTKKQRGMNYTIVIIILS